MEWHSKREHQGTLAVMHSVTAAGRRHVLHHRIARPPQAADSPDGSNGCGGGATRKQTRWLNQAANRGVGGDATQMGEAQHRALLNTLRVRHAATPVFHPTAAGGLNTKGRERWKHTHKNSGPTPDLPCFQPGGIRTYQGDLARSPSLSLSLSMEDVALPRRSACHVW